jgi:hypothetical protein
VQRAAARGLLVAAAGRYRPSERGLQFLNDLLLEFLPQNPEKSADSALSMATPEVS